MLAPCGQVSMAYTQSEMAESIGTITLDHERRRNALSRSLVEEVIAALRSFQSEKVRVVILRAKPGSDVFSAGHDIDELPEPSRSARLGRSVAPARSRDLRRSKTRSRESERLHIR